MKINIQDIVQGEGQIIASVTGTYQAINVIHLNTGRELDGRTFEDYYFISFEPCSLDFDENSYICCNLLGSNDRAGVIEMLQEAAHPTVDLDDGTTRPIEPYDLNDDPELVEERRLCQELIDRLRGNNES